MEDMNRKHVVTDYNMLYLYEDFSRSPETNDTKPLTARDDYIDSGIGVDWKMQKLLRREKETTFI